MEADNHAFRAEIARQQDVWNEHVEHQEFASPQSPKRKFDEMGQGDNVPALPTGPPPAYSPPINGQFSGGDEKSGFADFPSPPTYNDFDKKGGKEVEVPEKKEGHGEMVEMQTKGNVPRLISTMSMDIREPRDDAMDVDNLRSTENSERKQ